MNIAISIRGPIIATKYEPIQEEEWKYTKLLDKIAAKTDDDVSFWVAFFAIPKDSILLFVDDLEKALDEVAPDVFAATSIDGPRYAYVLAVANAGDFDWEPGEDVEAKIWAACMRVASAHEREGCSLFAPKSFLAFDREGAERILREYLDIDISLLS